MVGEDMKTDEINGSKNVYKFIGFFAITLSFVLVFVLLLNKHTDNLGDKLESSFNYETIPLKQLVARNTDSIYPQYFVAFFAKDGSFIVHNFNYYETNSQYDLEYNRLFDKVIDYNPNQNMLRIKYYEGAGNYNEVKNNFGRIIGVDSLEIYE